MRKLTIIFLLILFSVGCGPSGNQPEPKPQPPEDTEPFQASLQIYLEGERADDAPQALLLDINKLEICGGRGCLELAINKIVDLYEEVPSAATLELTKIEEYLEPTSEGNQKLRVESLGIYLGDQNSVTFNGKEHLIKLAPEKEILLLEDISSLTKGHSVINILVRPTLLTESSSVVPLQDAPTYELDFDINLVFCKVSSSMQKITPNTTVAGLDGLTVYSKPEHILKYGVFKYGALFGGFIERGKFAYSNTYYLTYCPYLLSQQTDQLENFVVSIPLKQPVQGDIAILANKMSFLTTARRNNKLEARLSDIPELISRFTQTSEAPQANIAILRAAVKGEQNVYSRNLRIPYESNGVIYREMLVGSSQLHVVEVPLNTAQYEIQILSDQTQAGERIPLRTVKQLVAESAKKGTTVAINAGPWEDNNPPWQPTGQKDNDKGLDFSWTTVISGIVRQHQNADGKDQVLLGMDYTDSKNQFEVVSIKKKNIDQVFGEKLFTLSDGKPSHIQGSTTSILLLKKNKENKDEVSCTHRGDRRLQEAFSLVGYGVSKFVFVSTDQADNRTGEHKIETSLDRLCDFLAEDLELTHAILLDGGAAASLVLNNELVNPLGKYYRGSGYGEARYVASAIAFVPVTPAPVDPPPTPQPSVPKPLSPQGTIGTLTPTFKWTRVANATYSLYISKAPYGEANVIFEKEDITGTSFTIPSGNLENNTKYRFDVRANLNGKWSSYSENMYFEIRVPVVRSVVSGSISNLPNGNWHIMAYDLKAQKVIGPSSEVTANNFSLDIEETSRMLALSKLDPPSGASIDPSDVQLGTMTLLVFDDTNNDGVPSVGERARLVNDPENTFPVNSDKYIQLWYSDISYQITGKSRTSTGSPVSWKIDTTNYVERWRYGLKDTGSSVEVTNSRQLKDLDLDIGRILNVSTTGSLQFEGLGGDLLID